MRDILLKRNELKSKSIHLRTMRFEPGVSNKQVMENAKTQNELYSKWNFYDKFVKVRDEVKNETKSNNVGKEE